MDCCLKYKWKYKAEGNKHIVVSNGKGYCLRLLKCDSTSHRVCSESNDEKDSLLSSSIENDKLNELKFIQLIVLPLLSFSDACNVPEIIELPKQFFCELDKQIIADRPKHRIHQSLCHTAPALLMPDYCFIPSTDQFQKLVEHGVCFDSNVFSVEIKLKKGFFKQDEVVSKSICQFCKMQLFRVLQEKRHKQCSFYCPLDLFSGDEKRMKKALHCLFCSPQNNLRLFHNGELIYSQEVLDASLNKRCLKDINGSKPTDSIIEELLPQLFSLNKIVLLEPQTIIDILQQALLLPVIPTAAENVASAGHCNGESYKKVMCNHSQVANGVSLHSSKNNLASLPSNSILGLILSQQKLGKWSLLKLQSKLQGVDLYSDENCDAKKVLNVDAFYDSPGWQKFVLEPYSTKTQENGKVNQLQELSHQLRQFLVSKSFCDCSVMISFQRISAVPDDWFELKNCLPSAYPPSAKFNLVADQNEHEYVVSIAVVDTDPKYLSNMPLYQEKYSQISKWWDTVHKS